MKRPLDMVEKPCTGPAERGLSFGEPGQKKKLIWQGRHYWVANKLRYSLTCASDVQYIQASFAMN
jgi:hypothetical protein